RATPGGTTIDDPRVQCQAPGDRQIKTLVYSLDGVLTLVLMRGDHALTEQKLIDATGAVTIRPAQPEEIRDALGALPGSLGAVGVTDHPIIADAALRGRRGMYTGANVDDTHLRGVDVERDITVGTWADLREAAAVEVHHDEKGIIWPVAIAPFEVVVVVAQQDDAAVAAAGERVYQALLDAGVEVIVDDRQVRAGVKFSDAELVGIPFRVTVGKKSLAAGTAELTDRATGSTVRIPLDDLPKHV